MPIDYSKYPWNWVQIRDRILRRAGGKGADPRPGACCEWCGASNWLPHPDTGSKVVLTVAHINDPDPANVDEENLAALCQKCHNAYDAPMRAKNRARRVRQEQLDAGQREMEL